MESVGPPSGTLYIPGYTFKQITGTFYIPGYTFIDRPPLVPFIDQVTHLNRSRSQSDHHLMPFIYQVILLNRLQR